jgi:voltage-gated potassium channel
MSLRAVSRIRIGHIADSAHVPRARSHPSGDIADASAPPSTHACSMNASQADVDVSVLAAGRSRVRGQPPWTLVARLEWTPARAVRAIAFVTLLVTLASGALMWLIDRKEFPTLGRGLWWATQTVSTVGYGDVVPHCTRGRLVAIVVMLSALAFLTVVTAAITATLLEGTHRRLQERALMRLDAPAEDIRHPRPENP